MLQKKITREAKLQNLSAFCAMKMVLRRRRRQYVYLVVHNYNAYAYSTLLHLVYRMFPTPVPFFYGSFVCSVHFILFSQFFRRSLSFKLFAGLFLQCFRLRSAAHKHTPMHEHRTHEEKKTKRKKVLEEPKKEEKINAMQSRHRYLNSKNSNMIFAIAFEQHRDALYLRERRKCNWRELCDFSRINWNYCVNNRCRIQSIDLID